MSGQFAGTSTVRNPDTSSRTAMTRRAWWLIGLNLLIPGSAQVLAGNRRLGRFGLAATIVTWVLLAVVIVVNLVAKNLLYSALTNSWALLAGQFMLVLYAALWIVLTLDTLRLTRLVKVRPSARPIVATLALIGLVATAGTAGYSVYLAGVTRGALDQVFAEGPPADPINGRYTVMLLGGDAGADRTGLRPDSISVASIEAATGKTTIFGIPRNLEQVPFADGSPLYGPFPNGYNCGDDCLISYLYTYGQEHPELYPDAEKQGSQPGIEATRDAVEGVLGIQIQYYALIDMKGFSSLIDALGGITIEVKKRLPIEGGIDANGQPTHVKSWIEPGVQKMDGYTALWYARSRHGTSDYDRMKRQRDVQAAVLEQFQPSVVLLRFQSVAEAGSRIVKTDIPQRMLGQFVELAGKARDHELNRVELVPPLVDVVYPNFSDIHAIVQENTVLSDSN